MNKTFPYFTAIFAGCLKLMIQQKKKSEWKKKKSFYCSFLPNNSHLSHAVQQTQQSQVGYVWKMTGIWAVLRASLPSIWVRKMGLYFQLGFKPPSSLLLCCFLQISSYKLPRVSREKKVRRTERHWLSMCFNAGFLLTSGKKISFKAINPFPAFKSPRLALLLYQLMSIPMPNANYQVSWLMEIRQHAQKSQQYISENY